MPPSIPSLKTPSWLNEFRAFIMRGSVVDLAVGIIIGAAFTGVVGSLVKDESTPCSAWSIGGVDFSNLFVALNGQHYDPLADAQHAGAPTLNFGLFINAIINFLIVGFAIFWVVKGLTRLHLREEATVRTESRETAGGDPRHPEGAGRATPAAELTKFSARRLARRLRLRCTRGERRHATFPIAVSGSAVPRPWGGR